VSKTGFPGHNRGKKWVPGVGYRYPTAPEKPKPVCACGRIANVFFATGEHKCFECAAQEEK
jgi:hypothetical protein